MKGKRLAIMSWAGGAGVFATDACRRYGLELPKLSPATVAKIRQLAPPWLSINNPVDLWASIGLIFANPQSFKDRVQTILEALLAEEHADAVMAVAPDFVEMFGEAGDISSLFFDIAETLDHRPLIFAISGTPGAFVAKIEQSNRMVVFPSPERGVRALSKLWSYTQRFEGT